MSDKGSGFVSLIQKFREKSDKEFKPFPTQNRLKRDSYHLLEDGYMNQLNKLPVPIQVFLP